MLETRLPVSSLSSSTALPHPAARPAPRQRPRTQTRPRTTVRAAVSARPARTVAPPLAPSRRAVRRPLSQSRLARSEARMLTLAVGIASLTCAVLVIYLAAYAHVTQLGLEQDAAHQQWIHAERENHRLQVQQAELQNPAVIAARATRLGMALYTGPTAYVTAPTAQGVSEETNSGPTANNAAGGH